MGDGDGVYRENVARGPMLACRFRGIGRRLGEASGDCGWRVGAAPRGIRARSSRSAGSNVDDATLRHGVTAGVSASSARSKRRPSLADFWRRGRLHRKHRYELERFVAHLRGDLRRQEFLVRPASASAICRSPCRPCDRRERCSPAPLLMPRRQRRLSVFLERRSRVANALGVGPGDAGGQPELDPRSPGELGTRRSKRRRIGALEVRGGDLNPRGRPGNPRRSRVGVCVVWRRVAKAGPRGARLGASREARGHVDHSRIGSVGETCGVAARYRASFARCSPAYLLRTVPVLALPASCVTLPRLGRWGQ